MRTSYMKVGFHPLKKSGPSMWARECWYAVKTVIRLIAGAALLGGFFAACILPLMMLG